MAVILSFYLFGENLNPSGIYYSEHQKFLQFIFGFFSSTESKSGVKIFDFQKFKMENLKIFYLNSDSVIKITREKFLKILRLDRIKKILYLLYFLTNEKNNNKNATKILKSMLQCTWRYHFSNRIVKNAFAL